MMPMRKNHALLLKILTALLCLALLPLSIGLAATEKTPSQIRVRLQRLNLTDQAWLTLEGRYLARCANGTELLLPPSAAVTVFLRNGQLILFTGGISLSTGKKLSLLRQREEGTEPGIRFNLQPGLYPGDLKLSVADGTLLPVLTLPLETYLQGVVPYEMSDSFPLEALKVQAVCARTYALSRVNAAKDWDVVDTANDQVFRGLMPEYTNTARAVAETEGLVLTYNNQLITAWYSASNGGQTELPQHVWAGDHIPACFTMADDPWDTENPDSLTRKLVLRKNGEGLSAAFLRLVRTALSAEPELKDFRLDADAVIRVDALRKAELVAPRYPEPSRLMTKVNLTLDLSAELKPGHTVPADGETDLDIRDVLMDEPTPAPTDTPAPTAVPEGPVLIPAGTFTVSLDLFPEAVRVLGLSISGADNEIITLSEDEEAFTLVSGRYGHGVGMSQRGAQYQASKDGRTCEEILAFYYPGTVVKRYAGESAAPPTPDPVLAETPGPVPTATPRPTLMPVTGELPDGAWLAEVENIDDDSTLNLRAEPSPAGEILMRLYKHQQLVVLEEAESEGWVKVRTDVIEGYVMSAFLQPVY